MEVRTRDAHPLTDRQVSAANTARLLEHGVSKGPFDRIADLAARALDAPLACLYASHPGSGTREGWHGAAAESLRTFIDEVVPIGRVLEKTMLIPHHESNYPLRGDGAAVRSGILVPVRVEGESAGFLCIADFRDRDFGDSEVALVESFAELAESEILRRRDRIQFEEEILKSRDRAEEMSRLKSVFLTNMSHEIRTPLTTILGFAEILVEEVDEEQREFVQLIHQGGERLMDTLMSILDLARLESSSFDISLETFDVSEKVWEMCHLMEPLAQEKGLRLEVNVPKEPVPALLDVSAIERTVSALVSNGIKFTKQGSVIVTLEADDDLVLLHVADTGIGISNEFMPFLFEEFKQESEGLSRMHEGSGLGLSITKRLVELMKGDIMAESEKGQGSVFTVALPRNGEASLKSGDVNGQAGHSRPRVLVVEDNADTRTLVNHLLRKNYEVVCASDGDEALRLAAENNYDVLLVDINLGKGKSGEDVLHAVKSLPTYEDTPIIAVTAYAMPGDRERFFSEGFDDYVSKPFSKQRLLEALEAVLE
jgi:signal transduction histidine kinase